MTNEPNLCRLFVYGTLKRGQCRERCWPHPPLRVDPAVIGATLIELGDYPGVIAGDGLVRGELWELRPEDMQQTLRVLDEVEGYAGHGDDLFVRRIVHCTLEDGRQLTAWAYFYNRLDDLPAPSPRGTTAAEWPAQ